MTRESQSTAKPLEAASRRLRRPPGRPRRQPTIGPVREQIGWALRAAANDAANPTVFANALPPRGLPIIDAATYSGIPERALWRLISTGALRPIRLPGMRRVLLDRADLDRLLDAHKAPGEAR